MSDRFSNPLIVGFISDLIYVFKVEEVARRLNFQVDWIENPAQISLSDDPLRNYPGMESINGLEIALLERLTERRPALVLFDLNNTSIPWKRWIALIKSDPATRRIPVLCFGPHRDVEAIRAARSAGADAVVARSRFMSDLPELIQKYARQIDRDALLQTCQESLSSEARQGIETFNKGEYFQAHEELETAWNLDQSPGRELYRAILQVAVAYLQIERGNYQGALKMFLRLRQWIDPLPDVCRGIDVASLRRDARQVYEALLVSGPEEMDKFDRRLLKPVNFTKFL
jgi:uncharacterized protein